MDSCTRLKLLTCSKYQNDIRDNQYNILCGLVVRTTDSYTCDRWFDSYQTHIFLSFFLFVLELYVHVNKFSVMSGRFPLFIGWTSSKKWIPCVIVTALAVSLEMHNAQVAFYFFFFHWDCRVCRCSPKIMFYMISTMAQMAHFFISVTFHNSEFRILNSEFRILNSEFWINLIDAFIFYIIHLCKTPDRVITPYSPEDCS